MQDHLAQARSVEKRRSVRPNVDPCERFSPGGTWLMESGRLIGKIVLKVDA